MKSHKFPLSRFCVAAILLVMASFGLGSQSAVAQIPVTDALNLAANQGSLTGELGEYIETATRWKGTITEYQNQLERYQSTISELQSLTSSLNSLSLPGSVKLQPISESSGISSKCHVMGGIGGMFSLDSLTKVFNINGSGDIIEQQKQICAMRITMQNRKYNEAVLFQNETMPQVNNLMSELISRIKGKGECPGDQVQHQTDTSATNADVQKKIQEFSQRQQQYDALISALTERQKILAQQAFKGTDPIVGALVQTATLKAALEVGH